MDPKLDEILEKLIRIFEKIEDITANVKTACDRLSLLVANLPAAPVKTVAAAAWSDDAELDSKFGNPEVRRDPKFWQGESCIGKRFSECDPHYLEELARLFDWQSKKDSEKKTPEGDKYSAYAAKDAARARGWARRNMGEIPF